MRKNPKLIPRSSWGLIWDLQDSRYKTSILFYPRRDLKGKELAELEKGQNTAFSRRRVKVEHAISGTKRNRSVQDIHPPMLII